MDSMTLFISESFRISASDAKRMIDNFSFKLNNKLMNMAEMCEFVGEAQSEFYVKLFNNREMYLDNIDTILKDDSIYQGQKIVDICLLLDSANKNVDMLCPVESGFISIDMIERVLVSVTNETGFNESLNAAKRHLQTDCTKAIAILTHNSQYKA